jgi:uncharacterized damage-inducible protein DinB
MVSRQIERAVTGLTEEQADFRFGEGIMSVRDTLVHLADNCLALSAELEGRKHDFGAWRPSGEGLVHLLREWGELREQALAKVAERLRGVDLDALMKVSFATWPGWKVLTEWVVTHDAYHLGQICALRLAQCPDWDMYTVYDPDEKSE